MHHAQGGDDVADLGHEHEPAQADDLDGDPSFLQGLAQHGELGTLAAQHRDVAGSDPAVGPGTRFTVGPGDAVRGRPGATGLTRSGAQVGVEAAGDPLRLFDLP